MEEMWTKESNKCEKLKAWTKMSGMCEHPVRVYIVACEITFCYDFFSGFNLLNKHAP